MLQCLQCLINVFIVKKIGVLGLICRRRKLCSPTPNEFWTEINSTVDRDICLCYHAAYALLF